MSSRAPTSLAGESANRRKPGRKHANSEGLTSGDRVSGDGSLFLQFANSLASTRDGPHVRMIHRIVQFALRQRFLILMLTVFILVVGAVSFQRMPVDAYPDLSPPMVEVITQWPGHAAEEVERLVTLPTEVEMNGVAATWK